MPSKIYLFLLLATLAGCNRLSKYEEERSKTYDAIRIVSLHMEAGLYDDAYRELNEVFAKYPATVPDMYYYRAILNDHKGLNNNICIDAGTYLSTESGEGPTRDQMRLQMCALLWRYCPDEAKYRQCPLSPEERKALTRSQVNIVITSWEKATFRPVYKLQGRIENRSEEYLRYPTIKFTFLDSDGLTLRTAEAGILDEIAPNMRHSFDLEVPSGLNHREEVKLNAVVSEWGQVGE